MNSQDIASKIAGRQAAGDVADLIGDQLCDRAFFGRFIEVLQEKFGDGGSDSIVPPEPVSRLGRTVVPFGVYRESSFDETPIAYLDWLCREQESFLSQLKAYLKHPDIDEHRRTCVDRREDA